MRILLTGASGQIGGELLPLLLDHDIVAPTRAECDLTDTAAIRSVVRTVRPDLIINPAAYTRVDEAERERDAAWRINSIAPAVLAEEAARGSIPLIHFSTDYVFDGTASEPYTEEAPTRPINVYGQSKLEGELAVAAAGCPYVILRTSWVYSRRGRNFLLTIERLARERGRLAVVADQVGTPNWAGVLARATRDIALLPRDRLATVSGIYHLSCKGSTTWHGFAEAIIASLACATAPRVEPIPTSGYPTPARRPPYSVLSTRKLATTFGIDMPAWEAALAECQAGRQQGAA